MDTKPLIPEQSGQLSAKALKAYAAQRARDSSPAHFLGVAPGARSTRMPQLVLEGLPTVTVDTLAAHLGLPVAEFTARYAQISRQTLARRRTSGRLNAEESDRVARFARLLRQAVALLAGDEAAALRWLKSPHHLLEGQSPLEYARTESGAAEVLQLMGRIEAGVYS